MKVRGLDVGLSPGWRSCPGTKVWELEGGLGPQVEVWVRAWTTVDDWIPVKDLRLGP